MRTNQFGERRRSRTFLLQTPMTRHGPACRQRPAGEHQQQPDVMPGDEDQTDMPGELNQQQRAHDPADPAGIGFMMLGEALGLPTGEVGVGAQKDQPGHRRHGDIDARHAGVD